LAGESYQPQQSTKRAKHYVSICDFFWLQWSHIEEVQGDMTAATERRVVNRRTEDIYRKAIEDIRDYAIFTTNAEGLVTNWNSGAQHILGYTEEEVLGKEGAKFSLSKIAQKTFRKKKWRLRRCSGVLRTSGGTCAVMGRVSGLAA